MEAHRPSRDRLHLEAEVERRALLREAEFKRLRVLIALERERACLEAAARRKPKD